MRLIKPSFEIWEQTPGEIGIYKQIERAGRVCYKSSDRITEDSYIRFVEMLKSHAHGTMLEHGTVYLSIPQMFADTWEKYIYNPYSRVASLYPEGNITRVAITTNYRVLVENNWIEDLKYLCEPTEFHEKRVTVRFTTSNGIMREFTRHRSHSFAVESTRYCNYSKDKFSNEITFVQPSWCTRDYTKEPIPSNKWLIDHLPAEDETGEKQFLSGLLRTESCYMSLILAGRKPQEARDILPLATKCDMIMTGFVSDWQHFFKLRCATDAHPDARALAEPLMHEFEKRQLI